MFKLLKLVLIGALLVGAFRLGSAVRDRQILQQQIIRLHVVGASDSQEDQELKLAVRDAVLDYLDSAVGALKDKEAVQRFLQEHLPELEKTARLVIEEAGSADSVTVSLTQEEFDTRDYDSFSLPAGIYDSLRIVIGDGEGKNWWCVVFPKLCLPTESFGAEAAGSGFSGDLTNTLQKEQGYEVRFWLLDCIGRIGTWFH